MSEELKLERYRPTMTADVLHSWAADAQAELCKLRAALSAIKGGGEAVAYPTYKTTPGESVAGIALRQLGDESRWVEIRDLNSHAFPNILAHEYYPVGTALRLPRQPVVAEAEPVMRVQLHKWGTADWAVEWRVVDDALRGPFNSALYFRNFKVGDVVPLYAAPPASGAVPVPVPVLQRAHDVIAWMACRADICPKDMYRLEESAAELSALLAKVVV